MSNSYFVLEVSMTSRGELVSFQCVVATHEWNLVKDRFYDAFLMQKKAYRRANGGCTAPILREESRPRFFRNEAWSDLDDGSTSI